MAVLDTAIFFGNEELGSDPSYSLRLYAFSRK
jgi:hypothetical protein